MNSNCESDVCSSHAREGGEHWPSISIVTPSFRQPEFLRDALVSVARQSYCGEVEHVVMDGGCDRTTRELLRASDGVIWRSEPDGGQSDALNKALALASGEIIGWLNADDFYLPGAFGAVAECFATHPDVDVVYGDCAFVDEQGRLLRLKAEHDFDPDVLTHFGCFIPSTASFFRRRLIDAGELRLLERYHYVMDYELYMHLNSRGVRMQWLPQTIAAFRWHTNNKSLDDDRRIAERMAVQDAYDVWPRLKRGRRAAYLLFRARHLYLKLVSGSLRRQHEATRQLGTSLVWWGDYQS